MATRQLGYYNTGQTQGFAYVGAGQQRAYVPNPATATIIWHRIDARAGRTGGANAVFRLGIGNTSNGESSGSPAGLITYTSQLTATALMDSVLNGTVYGGNITPFISQAGDAFSLVVANTGGSLTVGQVEAQYNTGAINNQYYDKSNGSTIPTNPIGGTPVYEGHFAIWATGDVNVAPNKPTNLAPSGTIISTDLTPSLQADFSDANETLSNGVAFDKLKSYRVQVRRVSDSFMMWDETTNAGTTQQTNRRNSLQYAGSALASGVAYQHRVMHWDLAGASSVWSDWVTFTINSGGTVTPLTPSGKQNSTTPGPFTGSWQHPSGLSTNAAIVRILDKNGGVVQTMSTATPYATTVANGGTISIPWASTGFTALPRGGIGYSFQMRARDTGGTWVADWGTKVPFTVNATPNIPASLSPTGSVPLTQPPLLTLTVTDPDDIATALTVTAEIKRADTTTVTRTMAYNATTKKYQYQTIVGTDWTGFQTLQWRAKAGDGTSESAYSGYATFVYAQGPTVTVTAPVDEATVSTATTRVTWTIPSGGPQVNYSIYMIEVDGSNNPVAGAVAHTVSNVATTNQFYDIPSGVMRNGKRYLLRVTVYNGTFSGTSQDLQFNVAFTPPATIGTFTAEAVAIHVATDSDAILLKWTATEFPQNQFQGYDIYRTTLGGAERVNGSVVEPVDEIGVRTFLRRIPNAAQVQYLDPNPPSGVAFFYEIEQVVMVALDELRSTAANSTASVVVPHVVLTSAKNPERYGVELRHRSGSGAYLSSTLRQDRRKVVPVGGQKGRSVRSSFLSWDDTISFDLVTDNFMSADERFKRLSALLETGDTTCLRDFTGLKRFSSPDSVSVQRFSADRYGVNISLSEEWIDEGESA